MAGPQLGVPTNLPLSELPLSEFSHNQSSFNAVLFEKSGIDPGKQGSQDSILMAGPQVDIPKLTTELVIAQIEIF